MNDLGAWAKRSPCLLKTTTTEATLPRINLPVSLFEIHSRLDSFGHVSARRIRRIAIYAGGHT
ncbi:hypothetical protein [Streptomyces sp. NPDC002853]